MFMVEVRVPNLDCDGCALKIRKALFKLKGVEDVEIQMETKKITVRGYSLEEEKVLKAIKNVGKAAELWPYPGYSSCYALFYKYPSYIVDHYYGAGVQSKSVSDASTAAYSTYDVHRFFHTPSLYSAAVATDEEAIVSLFSDDNPHACSIM